MDQPTSREPSRPLLARLALGLVLAGVLAYVYSAPAVELFGRIHYDDAVFFGSAKALAAGDGFVLANLPGTPPQTKYPVLYPWLLSFVWHWNPSFPANIGVAVWLSALSGCAFLTVWFLYLRRQPGVSEWVALGCVALTAANAQFLDLASSLLSDLPFMALAATTLLLAQLGFERKGLAGVAFAGVFAGLAFLTRTAGVAFALAVIGHAALRREWRRAFVFAASCAPFLAGHILWTKSVALPPPSGGAGWVQVWAYVTSYPAFWKLSVPSLDVFLRMVNANFTAVLKAPASLALFTLPPGGSFAGHLVAIALSMGVLSGLIRQGRKTGLTPAHLALALTAGLSVVWNFPIVERLLAVFTPLFCLGAWVEGRHVAASILAALRTKQPLAEKAILAVFGVAVVAVGLATLRTHAMAPLRFHNSVARYAATFSGEDEATRWIQRNTAPDDVVLAYSEGRLHLETGRPTSWPAAFTTEILFGDEDSLERQFDSYLDAGEHLGARYWVVTEHEMAAGAEIGKRRLPEIQARFPAVFRSSSGSVRIYDLGQSCAATPKLEGCGGLQPALSMR